MLFKRQVLFLGSMRLQKFSNRTRQSTLLHSILVISTKMIMMIHCWFITRDIVLNANRQATPIISELMRIERCAKLLFTTGTAIYPIIPGFFVFSHTKLAVTINFIPVSVLFKMADMPVTATVTETLIAK